MAVATSESPYRGADRRMTGLGAVPSLHLPFGPAAAVTVLLLLGAGLLATGDPVRAAAIQDLREVLRAALLSGAGLLLLGQWRATGQTRPAFLGGAFLVLGVLSEAVTSLSPLVYGDGAQPVPGPALRLLPAFAAGLLLLAARRSAVVDTGARPLRVLLLSLLAAGFLGAALLLLTASTTGPDNAALVTACAAWRGALWLALCAAELRTRRRRVMDSPWLAIVLGLMAAVAFLDAGAARYGEPLGAAAAVLAALGGLLALRCAAGGFAYALSQQSDRVLRLTADVTEHQRRHRSAEESEAVRLHEVRNVLAGLHGATATLRRYEDRLDPGVRHRLEDAITAELARLQHLVDPPQRKACEPVDLRQALSSVLVAEREQGARIRADLRGLAVLACAADLATLVSALLVNARTHAPGSPVLLRARPVGDRVQLVVEDSGPGIPAEFREAVFERGERGAATAPGTGLGLYNARQLALAMGGTLELGERPLGGAAFVLSLPAATVPAVPAQRGAQSPVR